MTHSSSQLPATQTHCWKKIGIFGDHSCLKLKQVNHCRNCPVYQLAGRELLLRDIPPEYAEQWTTLLAKEWQPTLNSALKEPEKQSSKDILSVLIFRLAEEWFALPVWVIKEITPLSSIHTVPHRSNHVFSGIVNIRGEILMCIALGNLLGVGDDEYLPHTANLQQKQPHYIYSRTVVMEVQENRWAFRVDEIAGVHRLNKQELKEVPVVISKTPDTYTKKILLWDNKKISYLNYELLFYELLFYTLNRPSM